MNPYYKSFLSTSGLGKIQYNTIVGILIPNQMEETKRNPGSNHHHLKIGKQLPATLLPRIVDPLGQLLGTS